MLLLLRSRWLPYLPESEVHPRSCPTPHHVRDVFVGPEAPMDTDLESMKQERLQTYFFRFHQCVCL